MVPKMNNFSKNFNLKFMPLAAIIYLILVLIYIFAELVFNYKLSYLVGVESTSDSVNDMEWLGKIISGVGLGLAMLGSALASGSLYQGVGILKKFLHYALFGIVVSVVLQFAIIKVWVVFSSPEDKAKALLITSVSNTMVPYYVEPSDPDSNNLQAREYFGVAKECRDEGYGLKLDNTIDKILFPYQALHGQFPEKKYIKIVEDYNRCIIAKTLQSQDNIDELVKNIPTRQQFGNELYKKYQEMNNQIIEASKTQKTMRGFAKARYGEEMKAQWISASKKLFGQDSVVSPLMSRSQFFNHPDVKKTIANFKTRDQARLDYKKQIQNMHDEAMYKVFANYKMKRHHIEGLEEEDDYVEYYEEKVNPFKALFMEMTPDQKAFKATVLPIIILFFSIFFLFLNILSIFVFIAKRLEGQFSHKRYVAKYSSIFSGLIVFALLVGSGRGQVDVPVQAVTQYEKTDEVQNYITLDETGLITGFVYSYQKRLLSFYEKEGVSKVFAPHKPKDKFVDFNEAEVFGDL